MIEIFGEVYYIDFEIIDKFLISDPQFKQRMVTETQITKILDEKGELMSTTEISNETQKPSEINGVRFEIIRAFIDDISGATTEEGDKLSDMTVGFKLAFNTLTAYQILKPIED
jgi:hypothetical protein